MDSITPIFLHDLLELRVSNARDVLTVADNCFLTEKNGIGIACG
jgi:hypothetical protein